MKFSVTIQKIQLGRIGEEAAADFLKQHGYVIIERNFSNYLGEIDIIATDGDVLCFVEVKTRNSDRLGSPFEAVPLAKQRKIGELTQTREQRLGVEVKARTLIEIAAVVLNAPIGEEVHDHAFYRCETSLFPWRFSRPGLPALSFAHKVQRTFDPPT